MKLKVASFNILHCEDYLKEKIDFDAFAELISSLDADVVGLNEVHGNGDWEEYEPQAEILGAKTGYNGFFAKATELDGTNPFGNAVLTRKAIRSVEVIPIPDPEPKKYDGYYETRCVLKMKIENPDFTVLITHFGLNPDEQENAVNTILANLEEERCVLMGDLNVRPDDKALLPIRERMVDTASASDEALLSFPSDAPDRKIDYIFTSRDIKTLKVEVPDKVLSDHLPITAEIEF